MALGALLFCTAVLYAPLSLLCGVALRWQPMLIIISLLSAFMAFLPLLLTSVLYRLATLCSASDTTTAVLVTLCHVVLQDSTRLLVLRGCLQLQCAGWRKGWLLVRSRVPLVSLAIAVGAGFAGTSLLVGGGALLATAWEAQLAIPSGAEQIAVHAATLAELLAPSASCGQLTKLAQSAFQQTFFTCGHVAWTVMLGQAYAAVCPHAVEAALDDAQVDNGQRVGERGEAAEGRDGASASRAAAIAREELARLVQDDEACLPLVEVSAHDYAATQTGGEGRRDREAGAPAVGDRVGEAAPSRATREEREAAAAADALPRAARAADGVGASARLFPGTAAPSASSDSCACGGEKALAAAADSSPHSPVVAGLVAESVLSQQHPAAALLLGAAALSLHVLYVVLPLTAVSEFSRHVSNNSSSSSSSTHEEADGAGCAAYVPLQCLITVVSVICGVWIVHRERYPSAYMRLG